MTYKLIFKAFYIITNLVLLGMVGVKKYLIQLIL
jgi:hypothetical protein